jgi:asparagine synthetase B (glutamine-hydrolysing)
MCSFLLTNLLIFNLKLINKKLKKRGPDNTNIFEFQKIKFIHNLLSITGNFTIQPFVNNNIIVLFNGEIYNYLDFGDYKSDGEIIIPLYLKYGNSFSKYLDGEYSIALLVLVFSY